MSDIDERERATWEDIRSRSVSPDGKTCCADCYFGWELTGFACGKHMTAEERSAVEKRITELSFGDHPFFAMIKKP